MTEGEWIKLGYEKGIIECDTKNTVTFREAYYKWFCMKKRIIKPIILILKLLNYKITAI